MCLNPAASEGATRAPPAAEDALFGSARGDEIPPEFADPATRTQRIRAALAELASGDDDGDESAGSTPPQRETPDQRRLRRVEQRLGRARTRLARMRAAHQAKLAADAARRMQAAAEGRVIWGGSRPKPVGQDVKIRRVRDRVARLQREARRAAAVADKPAPHPVESTSRRVNLTDPQSRIMSTRAGWIQGYNAQLVVSEDHLILATTLTNNASDVVHYQPLVAAAVDAVARIGAHTGRPDAVIGCVLADAGYASNANLTAPGPDRLIALGTRNSRPPHPRPRRSRHRPRPHAPPTRQPTGPQAVPTTRRDRRTHPRPPQRPPRTTTIRPPRTS